MKTQLSRFLSTLTNSRAPAVCLLLVLVIASGCEIIWDKESDREVATWTSQKGWVPQEPGLPSPTAEALRNEAKKAFDSKSYDDALLGLLKVEAKFPNAAEAKDAFISYLIAECYFNLNRYEEAFEYYQKTLQRQPGEVILNQSLNRIYNIGLAFLHGNAKRSFGFFTYRSPTFGVDILLGERGLVTYYPYLSYSDDALLEVANYYFNKKEYPEAEQVYERLVRDHATSEWHEQAEYKLAVTVFNQIRGVDYDQGPLTKAKRKFNVYRNHYPRGIHNDEVHTYLSRIAEMEAEHDLKVAKYYLRESRPEAAVYYLRSVILNNPRTQAAEEARQMHRQMAELVGDEEGADKGSS